MVNFGHALLCCWRWLDKKAHPCDCLALQMLSYGCTRLEIGLQSIFEDVARDTNRGHTVAAVGDCFHLAKNAGFKVIAHLMPDLPNMGWERDMESFREFFENPDFRTDGLKVCTQPIFKLCATHGATDVVAESLCV